MSLEWQDALTVVVLTAMAVYAGVLGFAVWVILTWLIGAFA